MTDMGGLYGFAPRPRPDGATLAGRTVRLEKLATTHAESLGAALSGPDVADLYRYLFEPPAATPSDVETWVEKASGSVDPFFYAVVDQVSGRAVGRAALMRIEPAHGVIEVGSILWSPNMQRSPAATEAIALFATYVFEGLGYRRFEWKCNDLNVPSKRAAIRLGFSYEGLFRQHMVVKGRSRDTAWFAMTDLDWARLKPAYQRWLRPANFDALGQQREALSVLTREALDEGVGT
jgi:RimJ/RimL family protein N-acetyltransferase